MATAAPAGATTPNFPAGTACRFNLQVDQGAAASRLDKTLTDRAGNVVRVLSVGKGPDTTLTNVDNGKSLTLAGNGSGAIETPNADGTFTDQLVGHNILILFPTDKPAGPTTTLVAGTVIYTRDVDFNFTLSRISGTTTDLCAALA